MSNLYNSNVPIPPNVLRSFELLNKNNIPLPTIQLANSVLSSDIHSLSKYSSQQLEEFESAEHAILLYYSQNIIEQTRAKSTHKIRLVNSYNRIKIVDAFIKNRLYNLEHAKKLNLDKLALLPDDILLYIYSFIDIESHLKLYIYNYSMICPDNGKTLMYNTLNRFNVPILRKILNRYSVFCYNGSYMNQYVPGYSLKLAKKNDIINKLMEFLTNITDAYKDKNIMTSKFNNLKKNGHMIFPIVHFPIMHYEDYAFSLWRTVLYFKYKPKKARVRPVVLSREETMANVQAAIATFIATHNP